MGFEPMYQAFAEPCLTTWPRRRVRVRIQTWLASRSGVLRLSAPAIRCLERAMGLNHDLLLGKETFYH